MKRDRKKADDHADEHEAVRRIIDDVLSRVGRRKCVFRGESEQHEKCSSSLYRKLEKTGKSSNMPSLQKTYEGLVVDDASRHVDGEKEGVLAKVRHYGGSINLIDFTSNYLVALFFACRSNPSKDGRLIMLPKESKGQKYAFYIPTIKDSRPQMQSSVFVDARGGCIDDEDLDRITIRKEHKKSIIGCLSELRNISQNTLFNDLHGCVENQEKILETAPFFDRGLQALKTEDWNGSIRQFTKVIDACPGIAAAYCNRGLAHSGKGDNERAIDDYSKAIELDPEYAEAYNNRGLAHSGKGNNERAIDDYSEAIELDPEYAEAYNNRGNAYFNIGDNERAIADYSKAIKLDSKLAEAYCNRGEAHRLLGKHKKAMADYNRCERLAQEQNLSGLLAEARGLKRQLKQLV